MTQSFYNAIGGIAANQTQLTVVSDNIANMNTVGFKSSRVTFADVYYNTLQAGSPPTEEMGGTNPKQIGLGTKVSSIDRDFTSGTVSSTGISTDTNIQGNGFFVVENASGEKLFTRAGNFSIDADGYLVLPSGYRVVGATEKFSSSSSDSLLQIPSLISTETIPNTEDMTIKDLKDLNNCEITLGAFSIKAILNDKSSIMIPVDLAAAQCENLEEIKNTIQSAADAALGAGSLTVSIADGKMQIVTSAEADVSYDVDTAAKTAITTADDTEPVDSLYKYNAGTEDAPNWQYVNIDTGTPALNSRTHNANGSDSANQLAGTLAATAGGYQLTLADSSTVDLVPIDTDNAASSNINRLEFISGSSNFIATTNLRQDSVGGNTYSTKILDYKQIINAPSSLSEAQKYSSIAIADDGVVEITYSNGDKLSVFNNDNDINEFKYTTSTGVIIKGNSDVIVSNSVLEEANLQIQLANFINPNGLIAVGSNAYTAGSNSGTAMYGTGNSNSFGSIKTGGLEASNVDISTQFANMLIAQRAVEANSRVFSTANEMMQLLVNLGR